MALGFIVYYGMTTSHIGLHLELAACGAEGRAACIGAAVLGWASQIWFNVGMLVGVIAAGWVASRFGVIAALVVPALLMVPAMPLFVGACPGRSTVGAFLGGALGVGYSGVTPVLTTSLFPEHVRARAIGIVYHAGALLAAFVPTLIPWLVEDHRHALSTTVLIVVGGGLVAMSAAVLALRRDLAPAADAVAPAATAPAPSVAVGAKRTLETSGRERDRRPRSRTRRRAPRDPRLAELALLLLAARLAGSRARACLSSSSSRRIAATSSARCLAAIGRLGLRALGRRLALLGLVVGRGGGGGGGYGGGGA